MKIVFLVATLGLLVGCSTSQVNLNNARPIPESEITAFSPKGAPVTVKVVRDSGFLGSGCDMGVYIDGALAARLGTGESVGLAVPPGNVVVGVAPVGAALCSGGMNSVRATEASVAAGKVKAFRITGDMSGFDIQPHIIYEGR
jgi:hypothetical protein